MRKSIVDGFTQGMRIGSQFKDWNDEKEAGKITKAASMQTDNLGEASSFTDAAKAADAIGGQTVYDEANKKYDIKDADGSVIQSYTPEGLKYTAGGQTQDKEFTKSQLRGFGLRAQSDYWTGKGKADKADALATRADALDEHDYQLGKRKLADDHLTAMRNEQGVYNAGLEAIKAGKFDDPALAPMIEQYNKNQGWGADGNKGELRFENGQYMAYQTDAKGKALPPVAVTPEKATSAWNSYMTDRLTGLRDQYDPDKAVDRRIAVQTEAAKDAREWGQTKEKIKLEGDQRVREAQARGASALEIQNLRGDISKQIAELRYGDGSGGGTNIWGSASGANHKSNQPGGGAWGNIMTPQQFSDTINVPKDDANGNRMYDFYAKAMKANPSMINDPQRHVAIGNAIKEAAAGGFKDIGVDFNEDTLALSRYIPAGNGAKIFIDGSNIDPAGSGVKNVNPKDIKQKSAQIVDQIKRTDPLFYADTEAAALSGNVSFSDIDAVSRGTKSAVTVRENGTDRQIPMGLKQANLALMILQARPEPPAQKADQKKSGFGLFNRSDAQGGERKPFTALDMQGGSTASDRVSNIAGSVIDLRNNIRKKYQDAGYQ